MSILYLGLYHLPIDPRLVYREAKSLWKSDPECRVFFLNDTSLLELVAKDGGVEQIVLCELPVTEQTANGVVARIRARLARAKRIHALARLARKYSPDVVQASDAHELHWGLWIARLLRARPIYDAHEDYVRQAYEYGAKSARALLSAARIGATELLLCRFYDAVFCTDEYLLGKYAQRRFGCRNVQLMRNFPVVQDVAPKADYAAGDTLDLVYIGGVNHQRGVIEAAEYVQRYNAERQPTPRLTFTVFGATNAIVQDLVDRGLIVIHDWLDYPDLMRTVTQFDVGVCLWHHTPKMERNLPLKNFDYMSAGLPIITSDFGNLATYARASGAAIMIDPMSYVQFSDAIDRLLSENEREQLGVNGRAYVEREADFEPEAQPYGAAVQGKRDVRELTD